MKKFFLIPLLACSFCAMAFAATVEVASYDALRSAVAAADNGDVIKITADMIGFYQSANHSAVNIKKSITIDGQGHTLYGYGRRGTKGQYPLIAINHFEEKSGDQIAVNGDSVDVVIKNANLINPLCRVIETRGKLRSLTIDNCLIEAEKQMNDYDQPITIGGNQASQAKITIRNSKVVAAVYYPIITFNPIKLKLENTDIEGWCSVYFKAPSSSAGSTGSVVEADGCHFDAPNVYSGETNAFGMFVCEDDGVSISLNNCGMAVEQRGDQRQAVLVLSNNAPKAQRTQAVSLSISGDNTYINGELLSDCWSSGMVSKTDYSAPIPNPHPLSITISGGTYAFNPETYWWYKNKNTQEKGYITIPDGYEVKEIKTQQAGQETTLYRVRTKETATKEVEVIDEETGETTTVEVPCSLNDEVESEGEAGNNPTSSFDVATGDTVKLDNETTTAGYIQLQDNVTVDPETQEEVTTPTVIQVGKTETNEQTGEEEKVDQTLVVNNGLDIQGESQLVVQAGSSVIVGEGGIITENEGNIVLEANEEESVAFLLAPEVVVNTTPLATYKFKSKARYNSVKDIYTYQRFGVPTFDGLTTMTWEANVLTSLDRYNNENRNWEHISTVSPRRYEIAGKPFQCYNMTIDTDTTDIVYTFTGNLMGNQDIDLDFVAGWNCYANCYTAPINTASLLTQISQKFGEGVNGAIYIYMRNDSTNATDWEAITLGDFDFFGEGYLISHGVKEIAPMQAFILNLHEGEAAEGTISYVDNIYNPYMGISTPDFGHAPKAKNGSNTGVVLYVSDGTNSDKLTLYEKDDLSDEFDNGYDADKFDNDFDFSVYCMSGDTKLSALGSNSLADKNIAFDSKVAGEFTLTVEIAVGEPIILFDNVEEKSLELTTGASFTFSAEAINDPARFTINPSDATAIDNTEVVGTTSKFIKDGQLYIRRAGNVYTIQGQTVK